MNLLLINGSPRPFGNTSQILKLCQTLFDACALPHSVTYHTVSLSQLNLMTCKGCRVCFDHSEQNCPNKDDTLTLKHQMEQADAIIIGSPVYVEDISGLTKNWLDRMAFNCHRPFLLGKPVYLFVTSGAGASKHALKTLKHALISWGGVIIGENQFSMGAKMDFNVAQKNFSTVVNAQMKRLYQHLKLPTPALFSLVGFRIQKKYWTHRTDQTTIDYLYWKEKGWLENSCHFYTSIQIPFYKRIASSIISQLVGLIMLKS